MLFLLWHQIWGIFFPHTNQFYNSLDTTGCPAIQFNSDTNHPSEQRPHRLKAQPYKTVPGCHLYIWSTSCKWVSMTPCSGLIICWNSSQTLRKHFTYCYQFIWRDTTQEETNGRETEGKVWGKRAWSFHTLLGCTTPLAPWGVCQPKSSPSSSCRGFYSHRHAWLSHWSLVTNWISSSSFLPGSQGRGLKIPTL